jgi:hypothetical protein
MILYLLAALITAICFVVVAHRDRMKEWKFTDVLWFSVIAWPWCVGILNVLVSIGGFFTKRW